MSKEEITVFNVKSYTKGREIGFNKGYNQALKDAIKKIELKDWVFLSLKTSKKVLIKKIEGLLK